MPLTQPPFRADHVGSLLRPPLLARARAEYKAGRLGTDALRKAEDFLYQIGGVRKVQQNITVHFHSDKGDVDFTPSGLKVEGKARARGRNRA